MLAPFAPAPRHWLLPALALGLGCTLNPIELETDGITEGTTSATSIATDPTVDPDSGSGSGSGSGGPPVPTQRAIDLLFVVDNSGSMGEEQALLAEGIASLVTTLDAASPPVDYRVAVTTTDNGNPWCGTTTPEAGSFVATSCQQRSADFVFNGAMSIDAFDEACGNVCTIADLGLGEPWIDVQRSTGTTNVPGDAVLEALQCMLPQGINGCGFESQLESMWKSIQRSELEGEDEYGFTRPGALLAVVFITDEADCSYNNQYEDIFLPEGNRVFWSDPDAASPTSAVCWHAGVQCNNDTCSSVNLDVSGSQVNDDAAADGAVLYPVDRYLTELQARGAVVMAIDGVSSDGSVIYEDSLMDPSFQSDFGIGPGCESTAGRAVPPVRIHEIIGEVSGPGNERSICDASFGTTLGTFAQELVNRLP